MNARYVGGLNFREKIVSKKFAEVKIVPTFASAITKQRRSFRNSRKATMKKSQKKFGGFEILNYLCTPFREHFGRVGMTGETEER